MSKKVVPFALPPRPRPEAAAAQPVSSQHDEPDEWVFEPSHPEPQPGGSALGPLIIDLSINRSWLELAGLICVFPYLATWCWMQNAAETWLASSKQR